MNNLHGRPRDIGYEDPSTERPGRMPRLPHRSPAGQCCDACPCPARCEYRADRRFDGAADRQGERGQYRVTGADRLLAGPGFLDAGALPEISFRSGLLAWVPAGWRAAGRLQVKNAVHELACYLALHLGGTRPDGSPRIVIASRWVIDSRWVTSRWIPGLGRGIVMTCLCSLEPDM
jgi:hypothetical protein